MIDSAAVERHVDELLARPLGRGREELGSLLTDCAAVALQLRAAILEKRKEGADLETLTSLFARIDETMNEIRQRLDRNASRS